MKYLAAFLLIGYFALPAAAQKKWREADIRINGVVGAGTSYSAVVKKLGKPLKITDDGLEECSGGYSKTLIYDGLKIQVLSDERKRNYTVTSIELISGKWLIAPDIGIGANMETVRAKFGQPNSIEGSENFDKDRLDYVTKENLGLVSFSFRDNKLVKVELVETLC